MKWIYRQQHGSPGRYASVLSTDTVSLCRIIAAALAITLVACSTSQSRQYAHEVSCAEKRKKVEAPWHSVYRVRCYLFHGDREGAARQIASAEQTLNSTQIDESAFLQRMLDEYRNVYTNMFHGSILAAPAPEQIDGEYWLIREGSLFYPIDALEQRLDGQVVVEFDIDKSGHTENPRIITSSPAGVFDRVALFAVSHHRYLPRVINGEAVPVKGVQQRLSFEVPPYSREEVVPSSAPE
ncbi:energy transducer TonB [Microbulbifer sediminum]|uniref:energy transducer TonB n=1 Tax=Microbulbifer sediminum TaxID=2904250 RepID=UPI001F35BDEF|nr:energy transducer TonB [Microbulbifer sediminum]